MRAALPHGFVLLAGQFDRIAIICFRESCKDQRSAWPPELQPLITLIDGSAVDQKMGLNVRIHPYRVIQSHAVAWRLLLQHDVQSVLILEADWAPIKESQALPQLENSTVFAGVQQFLQGKWDMLWLGYYPIGISSSEEPCPRECTCTQTDETDLICSIQLEWQPTRARNFTQRLDRLYERRVSRVLQNVVLRGVRRPPAPVPCTVCCGARQPSSSNHALFALARLRRHANRQYPQRYD